MIRSLILLFAREWENSEVATYVRFVCTAGGYSEVTTYVLFIRTVRYLSLFHTREIVPTAKYLSHFLARESKLRICEKDTRNDACSMIHTGGNCAGAHNVSLMRALKVRTDCVFKYLKQFEDLLFSWQVS